MSGRLTIRFTADMPPAAVEVVAPDLATVDHLWLGPGEQKSLDVPSEGSFLRVHLASGEIVTLRDPASLDRTISPSDLSFRRQRRLADSLTRSPMMGAELRAKSRRVLKQRVTQAVFDLPSAAPQIAAGPIVLAGKLGVHLDSTESGKVFEDGSSVLFSPAMSLDRRILSLEMGDMLVRVRLPGSVDEVLVRCDEIDDAQHVASVRVRTRDAAADAIGSYMHRGDLYSAMSMTDWAEKAEELLAGKEQNPFAAAIGAFLLLRVRRIDLLHDWTKNLLDWFPSFSDATVIRAWHLIYLGSSEREIRALFTRALEDDPLPVFSEGLRLLSEGVRLLGAQSSTAVVKLNNRVGRALSRSPFTATVARSGNSTAPAFDADIDYAPRL